MRSVRAAVLVIVLAGLLPMSLSEAFSKVVEGLVLNLLLDLQKEERL